MSEGRWLPFLCSFSFRISFITLCAGVTIYRSQKLNVFELHNPAFHFRDLSTIALLVYMLLSSLGGIAARGLFLMSSHPKPADPALFVERAKRAIQVLNSKWYDNKTGIWDAAWWNSANAMTTLADFGMLQPGDVKGLGLEGVFENTFARAQLTSVRKSKVMDVDGTIYSTYCLNEIGCVEGKDSSQPRRKRGFHNFVDEYYDDDGWWALAMIHYYDFTGNKQYLQSAVDIFHEMQTGTGTPCGGGIYWNKDRQYVNAISNELYLSVAASLATRDPESKKHLEIAKSQWKWFKHSGMINKDHLINDGLDDKCKNNGMQTWSYNQGVVLGGLAELATATGNTGYLDEAVSIARAAIQHLSDKQGILTEIDKCELKAGNCGRDGQQFKGIFIRNLRYLHNVLPLAEFRDFIIRNANVIWEKNRNAHDMLGVAWAGPYVDATGASQSCALDAIVAAIAVA